MKKNHLLKTNLWLEYYWFDEKLQWKPVSIKYKNTGTYCLHFFPAFEGKQNTNTKQIDQ